MSANHDAKFISNDTKSNHGRAAIKKSSKISPFTSNNYGNKAKNNNDKYTCTLCKLTYQDFTSFISHSCLPNRCNTCSGAFLFDYELNMHKCIGKKAEKEPPHKSGQRTSKLTSLKYCSLCSKSMSSQFQNILCRACKYTIENDKNDNLLKRVGNIEVPLENVVYDRIEKSLETVNEGAEFDCISITKNSKRKPVQEIYELGNSNKKRIKKEIKSKSSPIAEKEKSPLRCDSTISPKKNIKSTKLSNNAEQHEDINKNTETNSETAKVSSTASKKNDSDSHRSNLELETLESSRISSVNSNLSLPKPPSTDKNKDFIQLVNLFNTLSDKDSCFLIKVSSKSGPNYRCPKCKKLFTQRKSGASHFTKCNNKIFKNNQSLPVSDIEWICTSCNYHCNQRHDFIIHKKSCTVTAIAKKKHNPTVGECISYYPNTCVNWCPKCSYSCLSYIKLNQHSCKARLQQMKKCFVSIRKLNDNDLNSVTKLRVCSCCEKRFSDASSYQKHVDKVCQTGLGYQNSNIERLRRCTRAKKTITKPETIQNIFRNVSRLKTADDLIINWLEPASRLCCAVDPSGNTLSNIIANVKIPYVEESLLAVTAEKLLAKSKENFLRAANGNLSKDSGTNCHKEWSNQLLNDHTEDSNNESGEFDQSSGFEKFYCKCRPSESENVLNKDIKPCLKCLNEFVRTELSKTDDDFNCAEKISTSEVRETLGTIGPSAAVPKVSRDPSPPQLHHKETSDNNVPLTTTNSKGNDYQHVVGSVTSLQEEVLNSKSVICNDHLVSSENISVSKEDIPNTSNTGTCSFVKLTPLNNYNIYASTPPPLDPNVPLNVFDQTKDTVPKSTDYIPNLKSLQKIILGKDTFLNENNKSHLTELGKLQRTCLTPPSTPGRSAKSLDSENSDLLSDSTQSSDIVDQLTIPEPLLSATNINFKEPILLAQSNENRIFELQSNVENPFFESIQAKSTYAMEVTIPFKDFLSDLISYRFNHEILSIDIDSITVNISWTGDLKTSYSACIFVSDEPKIKNCLCTLCVARIDIENFVPHFISTHNKRTVDILLCSEDTA